MNEVWLELDCYYFQQGDPACQVRAFFDRVAPLYAGGGRKGVVLCTGWLMDAFLFYNGDLSAALPTFQPPVYKPWNYGDLAALTGIFRAEAAARNLTDFHVGAMFIGVPDMYFDEKHRGGKTDRAEDAVRYCIRGEWFVRHPEVIDPRTRRMNYALPVRTESGERICQEAAPSFGQLVADKMAAFACDLGFSALVFRDAFFTNPYVRNSHSWRSMPQPLRRELMDSVLALMARIRQRAPGVLTIGYSGGTSPMEEWRSQGFDLETLARSGNLDLWITQTWGGSWQDHWPLQGMGYTFQLANLLVERAMLADTPVKHLFVIETFDAWEPWDTIHEYPEKLAWSVWAHTHAGACLPDGRVSRCDGTYISWMNHGADLLPEADVCFLAETARAARADAEISAPAGMTLVYHRDGLERMILRDDSCSHGEEMDDWCGMLLKYGSPILFIIRSEWLPSIDAGGLIFPLPVELDEPVLAALLRHIDAGRPLLLTGRVAAYDARVLSRLGLCIEEQSVCTDLPSAGLIDATVAAKVGTRGIAVNQRCRSLAHSPDWTALVEALGGPVLARHHAFPVMVWETPEWGDLTSSQLTCRTVQSLQLYQLAALELNELAAASSGVGFQPENLDLPLACLQWGYPGGQTGLLPGCLESGMTGASLRGGFGRIRAAGTKLLKQTDRKGRISCFLNEGADGRLFIRAHGFAVLRADPLPGLLKKDREC